MSPATIPQGNNDGHLAGTGVSLFETIRLAPRPGKPGGFAEIRGQIYGPGTNLVRRLARVAGTVPHRGDPAVTSRPPLIISLLMRMDRSDHTDLAQPFIKEIDNALQLIEEVYTG